MSGRRPLWINALAAALVLGVLTVVVTWPLFRHPATHVYDATLAGPVGRLVQSDINLTMWILAWDSHALVTTPLQLFDANAFYPARRSLALSEHMLGNVPFFTPIYLATGNPVLAHQVTLLTTFVVAGLAMAAYLHHWTRDRIGALAGGCLFAFAPYRLWQLGNVHVISIHWLPLVPLGIDLVLDGRRWAGAVLLAAALALSSLCSYYVGYAAFVLAGAYGLLAMATRRHAVQRALPALGLGFGAAAAVVGVVTLPYLLLQHEGVIPIRTRTEDLVGLAFADLALTGPRDWASRFVAPMHDGIPQFLGLVVLGLATAGLALHRRAPRGALLAAAAIGLVLTMGPVLHVGGRQLWLPYHWLMAVVPGFSAMRVPQRFGALVTVAATALAGLGLAALRARLAVRGRPHLATALAVAVVGAALVEYHVPGLPTVAMPVGSSIPPAYRWLAEHGDGGALIEVPTSRDTPLLQSQAMYYSTAHWLPIVNGYAPYVPGTFTAFMEAAERLPDRAALGRMLAVAPLRWVLVRWRAVGLANNADWRAAFEDAGLRVAAEFSEMTIYEVPPGRRTAPPRGAR